MTFNSNSLRPLLAPQSIAIIGASNDPMRIGGRPMRYLKNAGFAGPVYPVNPKRDTVQGVRCYPSIKDVGAPVDSAVLIVPAAIAVETVQQCADAGVKSAILYSSGFAEIGEEGKARQDALTRIAHETGIRLLGPNTNGAVNNVIGAAQTFSMAAENPDRAGRVGMVSQSGGYGSYFLHMSRAQGLEFSQWVATGNECDVEVAEIIHYYAEDPDIDVIMAYAEGLRDGDGLIAALEAAKRNRKPVVFLKVGSSDIGAQAAASHTSALAGSDEVYAAVFREYGVHRAHTPEEFVAVAYAASQGKLPDNRRVGVLTTSGGVGVHTVDFLRQQDMEIPALTEASQKAILEITPHGSARNPVDTTGQFVNDATILTQLMQIILEGEDLDSILILLAHGCVSPQQAENTIKALTGLPAAHKGKILSIALAAPDDVRAALRDLGYLVFEDSGRAAMALAALARFAEGFERPGVERGSTDLSNKIELLESTMNEQEAKALLAKHGLNAPENRVAATPDTVAAMADEIGYPVALKILSADIQHKTETGGVAIGLGDAAAVTAAANQMAQSVAKAQPDAIIDGFLVEQMAASGIECILGLTQDPLFGPIVMFGLGGVSVEVFGDVTFRLAPVSRHEAQRMVAEIKGAPLLNGHRGSPPADTEALAQAIVDLSEFGAANADKIASVEVNPLLVLEKGHGVLALDAAIELNQG